MYRNARADTAVRPYAEVFDLKVRDPIGCENGACVAPTAQAQYLVRTPQTLEN